MSGRIGRNQTDLLYFVLGHIGQWLWRSEREMYGADEWHDEMLREEPGR